VKQSLKELVERNEKDAISFTFHNRGWHTSRRCAPSDSLEDAMNVACPALGYGATDAWIVDDDGKNWADFEAIKKHCAGLKASN
jgi:hypothetical protein